MRISSDKQKSKLRARNVNASVSSEHPYDLVMRIAKEALSETAVEISALQSGNVNSVYSISTRSGVYVTRIGQSPSSSVDFKREEERYELSAQLGIPVPKVVKRGQIDTCPYMVLQKIIGTEADNLPSRERLVVWEKLGEYSKLLGNAKVSGMGSDCNLSKSQWVEQSIGWLFGDNTLIARGTLSEKERDRFIERFRKIKQWNFEPGMSHGDPTLRNSIREDATGTIYLIDFGNSQGHRAPHFDLSNVSAWYHDRPEAFDHFATGMGLSVDSSELREDVSLLKLWRYIGAVKYAINTNWIWTEEALITSRISTMLLE